VPHRQRQQVHPIGLKRAGPGSNSDLSGPSPDLRHQLGALIVDQPAVEHYPVAPPGDQ